MDRLLTALEQELEAWRSRTYKAEQEIGAGKGRGHVAADLHQSRQRVNLLEGENQLLRQRIAAAREQVERLRTRLRFVEEHGAGDAA